MPLVGRSPSTRGRSVARSLGLGVRASRAWPCGRSSPVALRRSLGEGTGSLFGRMSCAAAGSASAISVMKAGVAWWPPNEKSGREPALPVNAKGRLVAFLRLGRRLRAAAHIGVGLHRRGRAVRFPRHVVRAGAGARAARSGPGGAARSAAGGRRVLVGPGARGLLGLAVLLVALRLALLRRLRRVARRLAACGARAGAGFGLDAGIGACPVVRRLGAARLGGSELTERHGQQAGKECG